MKKLAIFLFLLLAIAGCDDDNPADSKKAPQIHSIEPQEGYEGDEITFTGSNFGEIKGESIVSFNGVNVDEHISWSDTEIKVIVPSGVNSGKVWVEVGGVKSNEHEFTINLTNLEFEEVTIGKRTWMKKNLSVGHYRNGDKIQQVTNPGEWVNLTTGAWCYYDNNAENAKTYGRLYNWFAVNDPRGLAPEGWRVASDEDWKTIDEYATEDGYQDGGEYTGTKMAGYADLWADGEVKSNHQKFNLYGFNGLPSGERDCISGIFKEKGKIAIWWTSSSYTEPSESEMAKQQS